MELWGFVRSLTYVLVALSGFCFGALWHAVNKVNPVYLTRITVQPAANILQSEGCIECGRICRAQKRSSETKGKP